MGKEEEFVGLDFNSKLKDPHDSAIPFNLAITEVCVVSLDSSFAPDSYLG
jgi:hypothetical protein